MNTIEINNLTKKYKDITAVNNLSFAAKQGELIALLGVNGAGKTTTVKMLSCLIKPTSGDASIMGFSITNEPEKVKEGIVMGKLGKYYEENCLMQQAFVKENKVSVEKHVAAVAKEVGGEIKIKGFYRFERGEGLEKKEENFAEEIAKQLAK